MSIPHGSPVNSARVRLGSRPAGSHTQTYEIGINKCVRGWLRSADSSSRQINPLSPRRVPPQFRAGYAWRDSCERPLLGRIMWRPPIPGPDPGIIEHGTHEIPMPPIATYHESRFNRNCAFELNSDSIRVFGKFLNNSFDSTIKLNTLDPTFERLWLHNELLFSYILFFGVSLVALLVLTVGLNRKMSDPLSVAVTGLGVCCFALALASVRKREVARFRSDTGVPLLEIGRAGKQSAEFDSFVSAVAERVEAAKVTP